MPRLRPKRNITSASSVVAQLNRIQMSGRRIPARRRIRR